MPKPLLKPLPPPVRLEIIRKFRERDRLTKEARALTGEIRQIALANGVCLRTAYRTYTGNR